MTVHTIDFLNGHPAPQLMHPDWPHIGIFNGSRTEQLFVLVDNRATLVAPLVGKIYKIDQLSRLEFRGNSRGYVLAWSRMQGAILDALELFERDAMTKP